MAIQYRTRGAALLTVFFVGIILLPAVAAEGSTISRAFDPVLFLPILLALVVVPILWKLLLPTSLSSLQVAFEVDDGLYEVHRLTKNREDAKELLGLSRVWVGVGAYLMAMAGILILIAELIILPNTFHIASVILIFILIVIPVLYSPLETLVAQLSKESGEQQIGGSPLTRIIKRFAQIIVLILASLGILFYGWKFHSDDFATWIVYAVLIFMSPTVLAYGRILGASWNMLLLAKWRTYRGQKTPIDPDEPSKLNKINSIVLVFFLSTMPLTSLNGIFTVLYVIFGDAPQVSIDNILNYGGLLGWGITEAVQMQELIDRFQFLKGVPIILAAFLSLNIAIVGLAFIFELIRNLFIGGQTFSGYGGLVLATPHEIRAEKSVQARLLYFSFAGFSGYTVLLLVLVCYKEFASLMPYASTLEAKGFTESVILMATWSFIAVGQAVFLVTWLFSLPRMKEFRQMEFDLSPEERREVSIKEGAGEWMKKMIHESARKEDINGLRLFQEAPLAGDEAVVRMEKTRAKMIERALRGLWPEATKEARSLLAQQGGQGIEPRLVLAASYLATRRLDAAKRILYEIPEESIDEDVEVLMMFTEFLDPWRGLVSKDLRKRHRKHPAVVHLTQVMKRLPAWDAWDDGADIDDQMMDFRSKLSAIAMLRMQRLGIEALQLAVSTVKEEPSHVGARIALALCLLDGMALPEDNYSALDLYQGLTRDAGADPRVQALGAILGEDVSVEELEPALVKSDAGGRSDWIDVAPVNPVAAMFAEGGEDEALAANLLVVGHQAIDRGLQPSLRRTNKEQLLHYYLLMPLWAMLGAGIGVTIQSLSAGLLTAFSLIVGHIFLLRMQRSQEKHITHRNQAAMVNLQRRMRRNRVKFDADALPVGTHLLLGGILISVRGVTYDIGLPGWLVERLAQTGHREFISSIDERRRTMRTAKPARLKILKESWSKSVERKADSIGALGRLLGADISSKVSPTSSPAVAQKNRNEGSRKSVRRRGSVNRKEAGERGDGSNLRRKGSKNGEGSQQSGDLSGSSSDGTAGSTAGGQRGGGVKRRVVRRKR